jgi:hypothetical protein
MTASKQSQDGMQFHPDSALVLWQNKIGIISVSGWLFKKKTITMHSNMKVKIKNNIMSWGTGNWESLCFHIL